MDDNTNNYVVGRGRLFFGQYRKNTRKPKGQLYLGNTPALSMSQDEDTLDHYSSEGGVRVKDASATLQNDQAGSFQCDNISMENMALWYRGEMVQRIEAGSGSATGTITFANGVPAAGDKVTINGNDISFVDANPVGMQVLIAATIGAQAAALAAFLTENSRALGVTGSAAGSVTTVRATAPGTEGNETTLAKTAATAANIVVSGATLAGGTDVDENIEVYRGRWHQLGQGGDTPQGVRNVGSLTLAGLDEDQFVVEESTGRFYVNSDAPVVDGTVVAAKYGVAATIETVVIARGEVVEGDMTFIANNAAGENKDYYWPYVKLTPDGDMPLKGDDWQAITFNIEVLKRDAVTERQYITARPNS